MKFSLTPILLLLVIVVVLVISCYMTKPIDEGFSTYNYQTQPLQESVILSYHGSKPLKKLYDNLYFDNSNKNIIEVISEEYIDGTKSADTYTHLNVFSKGSSGADKAIIEAQIDTDSGAVDPKTSQPSTKTYNTTEGFYSFSTSDPFSNYRVAVYESATSTLIHIMSETLHIGTFLVNKTGVVEHKILNSTIMPITDANGFETLKDGVDTGLPGKILAAYNNSRLLDEIIVDKMYFDSHNYNIIKKIDDETLKIYKYDGTIIDQTRAQPSISDTLSIDKFDVRAPYIDKPTVNVFTPNGSYILVFNDDLTITNALFINKSSNGSVDSQNGNGGTTIESSEQTNGKVGTTNRSIEQINDILDSAETDKLVGKASDIFRRIVGGGSGNNPEASDNDYILKTEIVPPVCPTCPSCVGDCNSVCTNCGGNGGSGTQGSTGTSLTSDAKTTQTTDADGNVVIRTVDSLGNAIVKVIDSTGNVSVKVIDTAGEIVEKTVSGTGKAISTIGTGAETAVKDVYSGAKTASTKLYDGAGNVIPVVGDAVQTVATDVYDGAGNIVQQAGGTIKTVGGDIYDGTGNILSGAGSAVSSVGQGISTVAQDLYGGIKNLGSGPSQMGQYNQMNTSFGAQGGAQGGANVPQFGPDSRVSYENSVSNYDYYGALPAKTSNYIARTANFSAFGK